MQVEVSDQKGFMFKFGDAVAERTTLKIPVGHWDHPIYGSVDITPEKVKDFKKNFDENVFGAEVHGNYDHGEDRAKGNKASGWVREVNSHDDGLELVVEFTDTAKEEIEKKEWQYISPEWVDEYVDRKNKKNKVKNVLAGFALTNVPFLRGISPINASEIAIAAEVADKEHTDPGESEPPPQDPIATPPPQDDDSRTKSNESEAKAKEGEQKSMDELEKFLREKFGIAEDADLKEALTPIAAEAEALKMAKDQSDKNKKFKDAYPDDYNRLVKLETAQREIDAKHFTDQFKTGDRGLAPVTLELVEEAFKANDFSHEKVGAILKSVQETGTVKYNEVGTTEAPDDDGSDTGDKVKQFADKIAEAQRADEKLSHREAYLKVASENPDLQKAYMEAIPSGRTA
jgi:hypothetical protein